MFTQVVLAALAAQSVFHINTVARDVVLVESIIYTLLKDRRTELSVKNSMLGCWVNLSGRQIVDRVRGEVKVKDLSKLNGRVVIKSMIKVCTPYSEMLADVDA